jgi:hypothetical protein
MHSATRSEKDRYKLRSLTIVNKVDQWPDCQTLQRLESGQTSTFTGIKKVHRYLTMARVQTGVDSGKLSAGRAGRDQATT